MKNNANPYRKIMAVIGIALLAAGITRISRAAADILYVGDFFANTVTRFDATTGASLDTLRPFIADTPDVPLRGPTGLIFNRFGKLLVNNQNVDLPFAGDVYQYSGQTGIFLGALVSHDSPHAPFAPRGIVLRRNLYLANVQREDSLNNGELQVFTQEGQFLHELTPSNAIMSAQRFHPRGLVFGPDGHLYVSNWPDLGARPSGDILSFDAEKRAFLGVFASNTNYSGFTGPEGLVFGLDGNLYTISFRADISDTDKIVVFAGPGKPNAGKKLFADPARCSW